MPEIMYSIVVPHRNQLGFLRRCVESIPKRDDIQIIVVDDNSDISDEDWTKFRNDFDYIELELTKEGLGAGYVRNVGLSKVRGQWLLFADSDDFFHPGAFERFDEYAESDLDLIYFYADSVEGTTMEKVEDRLIHVKGIFERGEVEQLRYHHPSPWGKMIRRAIITENDIRFEEIEVSNDLLFSLKLDLLAEKTAIISDPLYCATVNKDSLRHKMNVRRVKIRVLARKRANDLLHDHNLDQHCTSFYYGTWFWIKYVFHSHPFLLPWGIWVGRYKGATLKYIKDVLSVFKNALVSKSIQSQ